MQLGRRNRIILSVWGAVLAVAAFAMLPLDGSSTAASENISGVKARADNLPFERHVMLHLSTANDPFARPLPEDRNVTSPQPKIVQRKAVPIRVRAIVAGRERLALIDDGSSRIVGAGESVDGVRIVAIGVDSVRLADGRVLRIDEAPR